MKLTKLMASLLSATLAAGISAQADAAGGGTPGNFYKKVTFTVANFGQAAVSDVPVLVRLSASSPSGFAYADCAPDGSDIRFADADDNQLPHEIDTWNPSGESLIWVKAPSVLAGTQFSMYYKGSPSDDNVPGAVWSDYTGVWHLNALTAEPDASLAQSQGLYPNSTTETGIDGHLSVSSIPNEEGRFGKAFKVNDSTGKQQGNFANGGVWVADSGANSPVDAGSVFTISGWFKHENWDFYWDHLFYKRDKSNAAGTYWNAFAIEMNTANATRQVAARGSSGSAFAATYPADMKIWSYFTFVYSNTTCSVYQNGALVKSGTIAACTDNDAPLVFGNNSMIDRQTNGDAAWAGWIDEVRFAKDAKSPEWIAAEYEAMNNEAFLTAGAAEDLNPSAVMAPRFAPMTGTVFYPSTNVTITCQTEGAAIYYTTNGSEPTQASTLYTGPVTISATTTVKARAFMAGLDPSAVSSATYTYETPVPPELGTVTVLPRAARAKFTGSVESVGNLYATSCDVYLAAGTSEGALGAATKIAENVTGAFTYNLTGLEKATTYFYTLSISNNATTVTGDAVSGSFTTLETDIISPEATAAETWQRIQEALDDAAEDTPPGTVTLGEGLFEINAELVLDGGVTLVGQGWTNTIVRQTTQTRIASLKGASSLVGITVTGGRCGGNWNSGAGLSLTDGTVSWCCISNNTCGGNNIFGAGIQISDKAGTCTIDHSLIAFNSLTGMSGHGAGIGGNGVNGTVVVDTCLIYGNTALNSGGNAGHGAGIGFTGGNPNLTVRNTTIAGNSGVTGGGLSIAGSRTTLINTIVAENTASSEQPGVADVVGTLAVASTNNVVGGKLKFIDSANNDYHLQAGSPAAKAGGWYEDIPVDLDGIVRKTENMAAGCYECTQLDPGLIILSPLDVTTTTTSATVSAMFESLGEGSSATVTLSYGQSADDLTVAARVSDVTTDFTLTVSDLTHATHYYFMLEVANDAGRSIEEYGDFLTEFDPTQTIYPSDDPAENMSALGIAFTAAAQSQGTVTLGEGVFLLNAPLNIAGGITVAGQGWDKTVLKQTIQDSVATIKDGSTLIGVTVTGGKRAGNWNSGGGIRLTDGTVSWCCISNNACGGNNIFGAGILISDKTVTCTIDHSIIAFNSLTGMTGYGAGIGGNGVNGTIVIDTCLIYGNTALNSGNSGGRGAGIGFQGGNPKLSVLNTTIADNAGVLGGGLFISGNRTTLLNSIVTANTASSEESVDDNIAGTLAEGSSNNFVGDDPKFKDAPNGDYHLFSNSPAIKVGKWYEDISVDLDGKARNGVVAAGCYDADMGTIFLVR